jgi:predicted enzyme related to lactoylglutathione lyase
MFDQANVTLMVADMDRAVRFYTEGLGLPLTFRAGDDWAQVQAPGLTIGLHPARHPVEPRRPDSSISLGFGVKNIEVAVGALRERGVAISQDVVEGGADRIVNFTDPDGTALYLIELKWQG